MSRRIALVAAVALTVVVGGALLAFAAGFPNDRDDDPGAGPTVAQDLAAAQDTAQDTSGSEPAILQLLRAMLAPAGEENRHAEVEGHKRWEREHDDDDEEAEEREDDEWWEREDGDHDD